MKKVSLITSGLLLSLFVGVLYLASCNSNPCKTRAVECKNGGTCKDGDCICTSGYEGDSCQFRVNEKFDSYYACIRTSLINDVQTDDNDDTLRIKIKNDKFGIKLYSIRDSIFEVINGTVNNNFITIPEQTLFFLDTFNYHGNGSLNNGVLTVTLYKETGGVVFTPWKSKTTYVGYKFD
ncbi:MAG: hypothetical protein KA198_04575 [Chitinophagaceae bacterium]|nr:hypothetical protein [Chitinophagaceae bacterium]